MADSYALNHKHGLSKNQSTSSAFSRLGQVKSSYRGSQLITNHSQTIRRRQTVPILATQRKPNEGLRDLHLFVPTVKRRDILFLNVIDSAIKRSVKRLVSHNLKHVPHWNNLLSPSFLMFRLNGPGLNLIWRI